MLKKIKCPSLYVFHPIHLFPVASIKIPAQPEIFHSHNPGIFFLCSLGLEPLLSDVSVCRSSWGPCWRFPVLRFRVDCETVVLTSSLITPGAYLWVPWSDKGLEHGASGTLRAPSFCGSNPWCLARSGGINAPKWSDPFTWRDVLTGMSQAKLWKPESDA